VIFEFIPVVAVSIAVVGDMCQRGTNVLNKPACSIFRVEGSQQVHPIHWHLSIKLNGVRYKNVMVKVIPQQAEVAQGVPG